MRQGRFIWGIILALAVVLSACSMTIPGGGGGSSAPIQRATPKAVELKWGKQTKTTGCKVKGPLQDVACTPGDIFPKVTKAQVCTPGYAKAARDVSQSLKNKVYAAYGIKKRKPGQYEIDHLVSLRLGGSNDISNLWPQSGSPSPGFNEKDRVGKFLHDEVCKGRMSLRKAQIELATNWLTIYYQLPKKIKKAR